MNQKRIFISYSHGGNGPAWKVTLLRALHVFEQHHLLDVWEDGKIRVSAFWDDDITQAMNSAQLAVVLLTNEALKSDYIVNREFPVLSGRQKQDQLPVFPVICEPCDWRGQDWLRATQAPNESNPVSQLSEAAQDRVFRQLATNIAEALSQLALAELPKPEQALADDRIYLDRFPITRGGGLREDRLIGREQELALLDLAFAQPHTAIVSLVAWGGVGKSMLVQHWLQRLEREGWFGARRVYAWSFYSQGSKEDRQASDDTFLAHALEWFGVHCEPTLSPWDKGRLLADAVACERTLLILDGIEPLQYPPGPMGGQLRAPGVQSLLKQLSRKANLKKSEFGGSLCLVTTREPLTDLADFQRREGAPWGSVLRVDLSNLTEEVGAALLHHTGTKRAGAAEIKANDVELLAASRDVDGHALTLNLLGRFLARAHGGDIRRRDLVRFEEADRQEQGGMTFKMLIAFEYWFAKSGEFGARQLAVLRMLGLFDRPADFGCVAALRSPPVIAGLTDPLFTSRPDASTSHESLQPLVEEDWRTAISFLVDFGLIVTQASSNNDECLLDCHPLIREHFAKRVRASNPNAWQLAHRRLYEHLQASVPNWPEGLENMQPLYQAVFHGCQGGLHVDSRTHVFRDRILRDTRGPNRYYAHNFLGAFSSSLGVLACFFEKPWKSPYDEFHESDRAWLLSEAGYCLRALGRLAEAYDPMHGALELAIQRQDWMNGAIRSCNLSELCLTIGDVLKAVRFSEQAVIFAERAADIVNAIGNRTSYANALHCAGQRDKASIYFHQAEMMHAAKWPRYPLLYSPPGFRYCDFLLSEVERAAWCHIVSPEPLGSEAETSRAALLLSCEQVEKRANTTLAWIEKHAPPLDVALDHLSLGRAMLYRAAIEQRDCSTTQLRWEAAQGHISAALDDLRRSGQQDHLPRALLTQACLHLQKCDADGARTDLDEAWDIAERGPMRLHMADIHLHRSRLFYREKPYPWKSPQDDLAAAEKLIDDCGYHRRDQELADAKGVILGL